MIEGLVAIAAAGAYGIYKRGQVKKEFEKFSQFIERVTFQNIPFQRRNEMGYDIYFYQEEKFSLEIWKKDDGFILYVNDDEIKQPVFRIEKKEEDVKVYHPTISYYRSCFEQKKRMFQAFIHRYIADDFESVPVETEEVKEAVEKDQLHNLPEQVQEKIQEIQMQYKKILSKKDDLDIESYTLIETLVFHDLKRIVTSFQELTEESQQKYEHDVIEGMDDILTHLKKIEEKFENDQVRELKKSLRVLKKRGED